MKSCLLKPGASPSATARRGGEVGDEEASATWRTLALHMVQGLKSMGREDEQ